MPKAVGAVGEDSAADAGGGGEARQTNPADDAEAIKFLLLLKTPFHTDAVPPQIANASVTADLMMVEGNGDAE